MNLSDFKKCIIQLRSNEALEYEEGYHWLLGAVDNYLDEMIRLMRSEDDPELRGRYIELLGASADAKVIPVLARELESPHSEVRSWAYSALRYMENPQGVQIAEQFKQDHPDEEFL